MEVTGIPAGPDPGCILPLPFTEASDAAVEELFEEILDTLKNFDNFGRSHSPSIFLVYAHDKPNARNAHVQCVHHLIKWLQKVGAQILSDRSLLPEVSTRRSGSEAVRDILANQVCLLPPVRRSTGNREVISSVDKVLLCGSDVLREYCESDIGDRYMGTIEQLCIEAHDRGIYPENLEDDIRKSMRETRESGEVHHLHTELAFLRVRCMRAGADGHGIIPIALNGDLMEYVPFFETSNLVLKLKSTDELHDLRKLFFKVLRQLFTDHIQDIDEFEDCYDRARDCFRSSTNDRAEIGKMIQTEIHKVIERCNSCGSAKRREQGRREESRTRNQIGQCVSVTRYALFQTLSKMLEVSSRTFILVDALDECTSGTEREQLLNLIVEHAKSSKTKWLLSSRHDTDIKKVLINEGRMLSLELNEKHICKQFVLSLNKSPTSLPKYLNHKGKEQLIAKSDSTFLWVALACKRLRKVPSRKALSTLQDLPPGLPDLYVRMMDQVFQNEDDEDRNCCFRILRSVTLTFRPLSKEELIAIAELPPGLLDSDLFDLIELCGSFLAIREGIIYFIHQSAKDYLVTGGAQRLFPASLREEHG
ncbi:hypothetical protein LTR55_012157, partial [Exophiala xenobiotica]